MLSRLQDFFRLVLAVAPPWSSLYLHLPGSFEALAMKGAQSSTDATQKCQRRDRFSFIYRGWRSKRDSVRIKAPTPTPTRAGPDI